MLLVQQCVDEALDVRPVIQTVVVAVEKRAAGAVDGQPRRACLTPVAAIDGASVTTVEGLSDGVELAPIQQAFFDGYAAQCGFCSPGMMMAATALLTETPHASREQIMEALQGHICRCTGYVKIIAAVESVAKAGAV